MDFRKKTSSFLKIALGSEGALRTLLVIFLKGAKESPRLRTFDNMLSMLDKHFEGEASDMTVRRMQQFNSFVRSPSEDIKAFWIRFSKLIEDTSSSGLVISLSMEYTRELAAMSLSEGQRMSVLAAMSQCKDGQCPLKLWEISIKLLHRANLSEILLQQEVDTTETEEGSEQVLIAKGGESRNRPGLEVSAIKGAQRMMNFPNKGKGKKSNPKGVRCYRCGSNDRISRDCHLPSQPLLAFGGVPNNQKGKKKGKKSVLWSESEEDWNTLETDQTQAGAAPINQETGTMASTPQHQGGGIYECAEISPNVDHSGEGATDQSQWYPDNEWINQWWGNTFLANTVSPSNRHRSMPGIMPYPEDNRHAVDPTPPQYHALLDSGASYSAVGLPWVKTWCSQNVDLWEKCSVGSHKQFRFGSGKVFSSMGSVLANAVAAAADGPPVRLVLLIDIIDFSAPLLLSRRSLARMRAKLDFIQNSIEINGGVQIPAVLSSGGHILLPIKPPYPPLLKTSSSAAIYAVGELDESDEDA